MMMKKKTSFKIIDGELYLVEEDDEDFSIRNSRKFLSSLVKKGEIE